MSGPLSPGNLDTDLRRGLPVATDTTHTPVWTARNRWEDTDTPAARAAGLAWIPSVDGNAMTVELTTPWGKTLPSPMLGCAETSLFLRSTFAAWYELPRVLETQDDHGRRVSFGHHGVRTTAGCHARSPGLAVVRRDHTGSSGGRTQWPSDPVLRGKRIAGGDDDLLELADDAHLGAYLDEIDPRRPGRGQITPNARPARSKALIARPMSCAEWRAVISRRIRAWPSGTTG
jgi:hypothetical protein